MTAVTTFTALGRCAKPIGLSGPVVTMRKGQYYLDSGGHEKVKREVVNDLALGSESHKAGITIRCLAGKGTVPFRIYGKSIRQLINRWSNDFALWPARTSTRWLVPIVLRISDTIGTARSVIEAMIAANSVLIAVSSGLHVLYAAQIHWMLARIGSFKVYAALAKVPSY